MIFIFDIVVVEVMVVQYNSVWNIDQFYISKYYVWMFFVVIQQYFDILCMQFVVQFFSKFLYVEGFVYVYWQNCYLEWCDSVRLYDVLFVVVLFNCCSYYMCYFDIVVIYCQDLVMVIFILYGGFQCFGVFGIQLEDVINFDIMFDQQFILVIWVWIVSYYVMDICNFWGSDIVILVDVEVVFIIDVSISSEIIYCCNGMVNYYWNWYVYWIQ